LWITEAHRLIDELKGDGISVSYACRILGVSSSGYYANRHRGVTDRERQDEWLRPIIQDIFWEHRRRYGARRIDAELKARGESCSRSRVARLMESMSLEAIQARSFRPRTTQSRHKLGYSPNLLLDAPPPTAINQIWVGDITYIPLKSGLFGYLALLMDLFSRRIIGWNIREHMKESLTLAALRMAITERQPGLGLIHHSDRGGQYAGNEYRKVLERAFMQQSMSRADDCYDNAFMESCFGTVKIELEMECYDDLMIARDQIGDYIGYYNVRRRHSALGYRTPMEFEQQ
jgi:transposase InsO family protein